MAKGERKEAIRIIPQRILVMAGVGTATARGIGAETEVICVETRAIGVETEVTGVGTWVLDAETEVTGVETWVPGAETWAMGVWRTCEDG